jgi:pimeloyl-ACP methyl ester carboxylesterase
MTAAHVPPAPRAEAALYRPRRSASTRFVIARGLQYHVHEWGRPSPEGAPPVLMVHGWMDVGASFQFVVDALEDTPAAGRWIVAPDWRGFGRTAPPAPTDSYWFPDYLGDLDALITALGIEGPLDLVGHSMGGNVVMSYAGVRPARVRRLVNLEGFGLPRIEPQQAAARLAQWLDSLAEPQALNDYTSEADVALRLRRNNPRLAPDKAAWLARQWSEPVAGGRWRLLADAAHKRPNPVLYRVEEILETWRCITAPLLWVEAAESRPEAWWGTRYSKAEFHERLAVVRHFDGQVQRETLADCGHMLHHDQPGALAALLAAFLAPSTP